MKPRSYLEEGVVLAKRNYSESDKILSIYSKGHGRISLLAKGVRKPESRKRGHIEVFNQIKFQGVSGKGLDLITEAETIDSFPEIRHDLKKVAVAYYLMEVVGRTTHESQSHPEVYDLAVEYLNKLKDGKNLRSLRLDFVLKLITTLGFWPKGKVLPNPDAKLEEIIERELSTVRVGKLLSRS